MELVRKSMDSTDSTDRASIILYNQQNKALMIQEYVSTKWGFPKGYILPKENVWDSACRHLAKETGINLSCTNHRLISKPLIMTVPKQYKITIFQIQLEEEPFLTCRKSNIKWLCLNDVVPNSDYNLATRLYIKYHI